MPVVAFHVRRSPGPPWRPVQKGCVTRTLSLTRTISRRVSSSTFHCPIQPRDSSPGSSDFGPSNALVRARFGRGSRAHGIEQRRVHFSTPSLAAESVCVRRARARVLSTPLDSPQAPPGRFPGFRPRWVVRVEGVRGCFPISSVHSQGERNLSCLVDLGVVRRVSDLTGGN